MQQLLALCLQLDNSYTSGYLAPTASARSSKLSTGVPACLYHSCVLPTSFQCMHLDSLHASKRVLTVQVSLATLATPPLFHRLTRRSNCSPAFQRCPRAVYAVSPLPLGTTAVPVHGGWPDSQVSTYHAGAAVGRPNLACMPLMNSNEIWLTDNFLHILAVPTCEDHQRENKY